MSSVSSRIWTHVAVSISYNDNHYTTKTSLRNTRGVIAKVMERELEVREFELQSFFYFHFQTNTFGKIMNPLIP